MTEQLVSLAQLRDAGALSPEEFKQAKDKLLGLSGGGAAPAAAAPVATVAPVAIGGAVGTSEEPIVVPGTPVPVLGSAQSSGAI